MISSAVKIVSKAICLMLVLSFGMFVIDEATAASDSQATAIGGSNTAKTVARDSHGREISTNQTELRNRIDQFNDALTSPAEKLAKSTPGTVSPWIQRAVPLVLGLLVFGLGLHLLAGVLADAEKQRGARPGGTGAGFTAGYR